MSQTGDIVYIVCDISVELVRFDVSSRRGYAACRKRGRIVAFIRQHHRIKTADIRVGNIIIQRFSDRKSSNIRIVRRGTVGIKVVYADSVVGY